MEVGI